MNFRRIVATYCLILVVLTLLLVSCNRQGGGTGESNTVPGYYATATYGADMYHAQLTAIAGAK